METIGSRVAVALGGRTQKDIASEVGMTPDAFSRALRGERGFAAIELARLAEVLGEDVHYLITGVPDPNRLVLAARHTWEPAGGRGVPHAESDAATLADIRLAYEQADRVEASPTLPSDLESVRAALGADFVRPFVQRLESIGVDIVRVPELSTAYSFTLRGRRVIAVKATGNWFWENWGLAHELAHLVLGHEGIMPGSAGLNVAERQANAFAAELLMPKDDVRALAWDALSTSSVVQLVWSWGVSTEALKNRLTTLQLSTSPAVSDALALKTQTLLHRHGQRALRADISARMDAAATRHFPHWLAQAHLEGIAAGRLGKGTLAWMFGVEADTLEVDEPPSPEPLTSDAVDELLG